MIDGKDNVISLALLTQDRSSSCQSPFSRDPLFAVDILDNGLVGMDLPGKIVLASRVLSILPEIDPHLFRDLLRHVMGASNLES
ncbi:MAG TPA: hypothetical protein VGE80_22375 [Schlesneria sp.]